MQHKSPHGDIVIIVIIVVVAVIIIIMIIIINIFCMPKQDATKQNTSRDMNASLV